MLYYEALVQQHLNVTSITRARGALQVVALLLPLHRAHVVLQRQGIPRAGSGNPLAASAPWKRRDLHRLGQADCERLGGIFYFRILGFNVRPCPPFPLTHCPCTTRAVPLHIPCRAHYWAVAEPS